ncbi:MAG: LmeA family phospholipid-binding protein [Nitriliruptoraceae bacterium]|nr:LmeA family phospholipid-binding protein [Nitriliruptoraceae bacterium]
MRFIVAAVVGALLLATVVTELVAPRLASDQIERAIGRCTSVEDVVVDRIARPILPRLITGRARDVGLTATGLTVGDLRLDEVRFEVDEVELPWAIGRSRIPDQRTAIALTLLEADLQAALDEQRRFGVTPVVELRDGAAAIGLRPLPARVELGLEITDGWARLTPGEPVPAWFRRLGLTLEVPVPDDVELERVRIDPGVLEAQMVVAGAPALDGTGDCGPLVVEEDG